MVVMEPRSGQVLAMVGGLDYDRSTFNRTTQACRQPGSAYKPVFYSLALMIEGGNPFYQQERMRADGSRYRILIIDGGKKVFEGTLADARAAGEPDPYLWVACESADSRRIRTLLRTELGVPLKRLRIVGYWHADQQRVRRVWDGLTDDQRAVYSRKASGSAARSIYGGFASLGPPDWVFQRCQT